jgi:hypothetical protein
MGRERCGNSATKGIPDLDRPAAVHEVHCAFGALLRPTWARQPCPRQVGRQLPQTKNLLGRCNDVDV